MKKLRALFQSIIFLFVLSLFLPTVLVNAQSPEEPTTVTQTSSNDSDYQAYQSRTVVLFNTARDGINNLITTTRNLPISQQEKDTAISAYNSYLAVIGTASRTYTSQIGGYIGSSTLPPQGQRLALDEALRILAQGKGSLPQNTNALNIYNSLESALQTAKTSAAQFAAGSSGGDALTNAANDQIAGAASAAKKNITKGICSIGVLSDMNLGACVSEFFSWVIKNTLMELAGWFFWASANLFNFAMSVAVLDFKSWAPDALYPLWIVIRQIVSLLIVFAGLYLGFMYILGREDKFEKYIPWVVIFALFVNFSYPLVRTAVDISNIVSLKLYSVAVGPEALSGGLTGLQTPGGRILKHLGLQDLAASATAEESDKNNLKGINTISGALLVVVFLGYAAYIFFVATGIIVMRTLALVFLIIASPILFIDSVIPMLGDQAMRLRKIFFEQLAVAPIFTIMLAITLNFLSIFSTSTITSNPSGGDATITTIFTMVIMLGLLHLTLTVTKEVAGKVGNFAGEALGKVGGFAGGVALGAATGGVGLLARKSIGGLAVKARDSAWVQKNQDTAGGRFAHSISNSLAKSSFDLRNTSVAQRGASKLGINMGMGSKMNYEDMQKAKLQKAREVGERIKLRHERDIIKDGKLVARAGDLNEEMVEAKRRYDERNGGALFLTKGDKQAFAAQYADTTGGELVAKYKSTPKGERGLFSDQLKKEFEELKKTDPQLKSNRGQAFARAVYDIEKEETATKKALDEEFEKVSGEINDMTADKKQNYYARQSEEIKKLLRVNNIYTPSSTSIPTAAQTVAQNKPTPPAAGPPTATTAPVAAINTPPSTAAQDWSQYDTPTYQRKQKEGGAPTQQTISSSADESAPQGGKPGFLKTAEEKIQEREENKQVATSGSAEFGDFAKRREAAAQAVQKNMANNAAEASAQQIANDAIKNAQEDSKKTQETAS